MIKVCFVGQTVLSWGKRFTISQSARGSSVPPLPYSGPSLCFKSLNPVPAYFSKAVYFSLTPQACHSAVVHQMSLDFSSFRLHSDQIRRSENSGFLVHLNKVHTYWLLWSELWWMPAKKLNKKIKSNWQKVKTGLIFGGRHSSVTLPFAPALALYRHPWIGGEQSTQLDVTYVYQVQWDSTVQWGGLVLQLWVYKPEAASICDSLTYDAAPLPVDGAWSVCDKQQSTTLARDG